MVPELLVEFGILGFSGIAFWTLALVLMVDVCMVSWVWLTIVLKVDVVLMNRGFDSTY